MKLSSLAMLLFMMTHCTPQEKVSEDKFRTLFQSNSDDKLLLSLLLINKVHFPQWEIYYTISEHEDGVKVTAALRQQYEEHLTRALQAWLQPLTTLTDKKLIGSDPDDFVYIYKSADETRKLPPITADEDGRELLVNFGSRAQYTGEYGTVYLYRIGERARSQAALLHELGHAFGLDDAYKSRYDGQPPSVMNYAELASRYDGQLRLEEDDIYGIQWLYRYVHRDKLKAGIAPVELTDCPFPNYEYVDKKIGCLPRHAYTYNLKQAHLREKFHSDLIYTQRALNQAGDHPRAEPDEDGNTGLHYAVLFGAWSNWSDYYPIKTEASGFSDPTDYPLKIIGIEDASNFRDSWVKMLDWVLRDERIKTCSHEETNNCIEINHVNNDGDTTLHFAAMTGYTKAAALLLARAEIDAKIKNKQGNTACSIAKQQLNSLSAARLDDLNIKPEQTATKIQAINSARAEIVGLLKAKNACN